MDINKSMMALLSGNKLRAIFYAFVVLNIASILAYAQVGGGGGYNQVGGLSAEFCQIVTDVRDVVGVFALAMFLIGGILYAAGHFMPAAGQIRSTTQGWAMGMVIGGIIGLILVIIAPTILGLITSFSGGSVQAATCNGP